MEKSKQEKQSSVLCQFITLVLATGVIVALLVVLMVDLEPNVASSTQTPSSATPTKPLPTTTSTPQPPPTTTGPPELPVEGNFTYTEVPGVGRLKAMKTIQGPAIFAGIPYAEPPVGQYRWANPRPALPLPQNGKFYDATYPRPACPQLCTLPSPEYVCPMEMDEDCLHVVVYVPSKLTKRVDTTDGYYYELIDDVVNAQLPVMVFFHGGAFITGGNGVTLYDGRFIAEKGGVIVVTVNYRLGPFGFFYQDNGKDDAALGNFAIYDQIEALKWVQARIRNFGGDPDSVTLFGQSAGAQSVAVHLVNDMSDPLFHRAILQSNPFGLSFKTPAEAQDLGDNFVAYMRRQDSDITCPANEMDCLRDIPADSIIKYLKDFPILSQLNLDSFTQLFEPWAPVIDGDLLPQHPYYLFKEGSFQNKPMIHGFTTDEGAYFIAQVLTEPSTSNRIYSLFFEALFGAGNGSLVEEQYPPRCRPVVPVDCDNREAIDDWVTDWLFTCPTRRVLNTEDRYGDESLQVWWYTLDQLWSFPEFWENYTICHDLTCHAAELPYLFDVDKLTDFRFTPEEQELAEKLIFYWTNFAKYGDPNQPALIRRFFPRPNTLMRMDNREVSPNVKYWPRIYEGDEGSGGNAIGYRTMKLTTSGANGGEQVVDDFQKELCDFWDEIDFYLEDSLKLGDDRLQEFLRQIKVVP